MATRTTYKADGTVETSTVPDAPRAMRDEEFTPAMIRLRERIAARGEFVQPLDMVLPSGTVEHWFVKRLSQVDMTVLSFCMARRGYTLTDQRDAEATLAFQRALVFVACCKSETDTSPFFARLEEVEAYWEEPGLGDLCIALFGGALAHNPEFRPKAPAPSGQALPENSSSQPENPAPQTPTGDG